MASPAQLVETISLVTGVPLPTMVDIDRRLVTAGLRSKGGRGLHAARMTSLDAARLLTAVLASPQANTAADAVNRYARTRTDEANSSDTLYRGALLGDHSSLPPGHSFIDALASLISSASDGELAKLTSEAGERDIPQIEVFAFTRATRGRIRLSGLPSQATASVDYILVPSPTRSGRGNKAASRNLKPAQDTHGDLEQSRRVTGETIFAISKLLEEGSDE